MKNFNLSLFLGCCVISIGIVIAGLFIAYHLPFVISGSFSGTITNGTQQFGDFLSEYEASAFLNMNTDDFIIFIRSGELEGTYTVIQGNTVFSKEKLSIWAESRIGN
jgi:Fe2+ transport system protein B